MPTPAERFQAAAREREPSAEKARMLTDAIMDEVRAARAEGRPLSWNISRYVEEFFDALIHGKEPFLFRAAGRKGRYSEDERRCIEDAVLYVRACQPHVVELPDGTMEERPRLISDTSYNKTVHGCYGGDIVGGLSIETVESWARRPDMANVSVFFLDKAEVVQQFMVLSGMRYQERYLKHSRWYPKGGGITGQ